MEEDGMIKFVYEDDSVTKVVKGFLIEESDFIYKIKTKDGAIINLGKRSIIKFNKIEGGKQ